MPLLTVIVPTLGRPDDLSDLLRMLRPQVEGRPARRLVVVNDGGHDDAYAAVVRPHLLWMTYIPAPETMGAAGARNHGVAHTPGDILAFTHDRCRPPPDWLDQLEARYAADPRLDGVAGATRAYMSSAGGLTERVIAAADVVPRPRCDEDGRLICVTLAAFSVRRAAWDRIGGFDPAFAAPGDDIDFTQRLTRSGARIVTDADWWTGHTTAGPLKSWLRRAYDDGAGSARYAFTRCDWRHPDLHAYFWDEDADATVRDQAAAALTAELPEGAGRFDRLLLRWFMWRVASCYAAGFADGCDAFDASEPEPEPAVVRWLHRLRLPRFAAGLALVSSGR